MRRLAVVCFATAIAMVVAATFVVACGPSIGNISPPAISHGTPTRFGGPPPATPVVGDILFAGQGQWSGSPTGFTYQWDDCNSGGGSCTAAAGSPNNVQRYQIASGDTGFTIRVAVTASYTGHPSSTVMSQPTGVVGGGSEFPLQVSGNGRYLETAGGAPWLMVGDSPQSVMGNLSCGTITAGVCQSGSNVSNYFADRESHGFNAVWINLLCGVYTGCNSDGKAYNSATSTADNLVPFTSGSSPSTYNVADPNSAYFAQAHAEVAQAEADGLEVVLDPAETGGAGCPNWTVMLTNAGPTADFNYGAYLGTTFGDLKNITWMSGNDYQCWQTAADDNAVIAVAQGIQSTDPSALQSLEANYQVSTSLDDTTNNWASLLTPGSGIAGGFNGVYTYAATYNDMLHGYGQSPTMPAIMIESNYDGQQNSGEDGCGPGPAGDTTSRICRLQEWWTMTSGGAGQLYGGPCYGITNSTSLSSCDTTAVTELGYQTTLLDSLSWWTLAPDTGHNVVTSGFGTKQSGCTPPDFSSTCDFGSDAYVTAASDYSGAGTATTALVYLPDPSSFASPVVNLAAFAGPVTAKWFDPTSGVLGSAISGSPFTNSGSHTFTPSTNNNAGDKDWVLLLQG